MRSGLYETNATPGQGKTGRPDLGEAGRSGLVFDIQRFSLNDGHGIRTLVFLKGCPLRCDWCANPESQDPRPELRFLEEKCELCFRCVERCPYGEKFKATHTIPREDCRRCMECVDACPNGARSVVGKHMTVDEVMAVARRDRVFFKNSGGGVTVGGGEATMQPVFCEHILRACKEEGIHTAIETCGVTPWPALELILQQVDLLLFDLKHMDPAAHQARTGASNTLVLKNAEAAARVAREMIVRYPLIPHYNDDLANIEALGRFVAGRLPAVKRIDVMPYHSMGASKSAQVGKVFGYDQSLHNSDEKLAEVKAELSRHGLQVCIGG